MKKQMMAATLATLMVASLSACGASEAPTAGSTQAAQAEAATEEAAEATSAAETAATETGKEYKVGIVQFMDHPSLNQIEENVEKELDKLSAERT